MSNEVNKAIRKPLTREEAMVRFMAAKRHKQEMIDRARVDLKEYYVATFGVEPKNFEAW